MIDSFGGEYRFLSNFYPSPVRWGGIDYPTVEHAFQAQKTEIEATRLRIADLPLAKDAKKAGRQLPLPPNWSVRRIIVMSLLLRQKFAPGSPLAGRLLATGDEELVEGNWWHDNFWGDCRCGRPECLEPGQNELGKALMTIREDLR